jgi:haloalkane dehalogenase
MDFAQAPTRFIDVGHSRIAHRRLGRGPDVLFVHGWPLSGATFRHVVGDLAAHFTCHVVDLPGTGSTESGPDAPIDIRGHVATLRRVVDELGLGRYAIVAHDSGGMVARLLAAGDQRVAGLVLADTEIPGHHPLLLTLFVVGARLWSGMLRAIMSSPRLRRSGLGFGTCFSDPGYVDGEFFDLFLRPILESPAIAQGQLQLLRSLDPRQVDELAGVHAALHMPVRLIWGERDPFFPLAKARAMLTSFGGGADLHVIPRAKLYPHEDHPAEFVAAARPFLARVLGEPLVAGATPAMAAPGRGAPVS